MSIPPEQTGELGEDLSFLCQVEGNYTSGAPVWYDPLGSRILALNEGITIIMLWLLDGKEGLDVQ